MKKNVYILVTHPIQYFVPLYQFITAQEDINLKVYYCSDETLKGGIDKEFGVKVEWDIPLVKGYDYTFLKNYALRPSINNGFWGVANPGIILSLLRNKKGTIIINGWNNLTYIMGFFAARLFGHKIAIRCEAPYFKELNRKGTFNGIRFYFLKNILFKYFVDYFLYIGKQSYQFYKYFGVDDQKLTFTPYAVDNNRFRSEFLKLSNDGGPVEKDSKQKKFTVLFTGKLYDVKRPFDLLESYDLLNIPNKRLIIVGDGELRQKMEVYIKEKEIPNIEFTGFVNQSEISKYYAKGDVLVLCSESETWGLSINEAMNFELPIVAYDSIGCAEDLIRNGLNGYVVPKRNIILLAQAIEKIYHENINDNQMGKESLKIVETYSNESILEGLRHMDDNHRN